MHFDPSKELIVSCDASPYGIGAVLSHVMPDGNKKPIALHPVPRQKLSQGRGIRRASPSFLGQEVSSIPVWPPIYDMF